MLELSRFGYLRKLKNTLVNGIKKIKMILGSRHWALGKGVQRR